MSLILFGDPDWIRTSDPQLRRQVRLFGVSETLKELKPLPRGQCVTKCVTSVPYVTYDNSDVGC